MERNQRFGLYGATALAVAAAAAGGCTTDSGGALIILQNQVPTEGCVVPSDKNATFRGRGIIDVQATDGYIFTPVVESLVVGDETGLNSRVIAVQGADVQVTFPAGFFSADEEAQLRDDALTRFSEAFSGSVFPDEGVASFAFPILPLGLLQQVGDRLGSGERVQATAEVVIFGDMDGNGVESNPFRYPVDVCNGCMKSDLGDCAALPDGFEPAQGGVCNLLQDAPVDCCTSGGTELCPAPAPSA